jgi:hypothetical protein
MILDEYYPIESRTERKESEHILELGKNFHDDHTMFIQQNCSQKVPDFKSTGVIQIRDELDAFYEELEDLDLSDESPYSINEKNVDRHPSLEQMTFIYIVSNHIYSQNNMYKIGKHKGTKKMLIKRYKTYLIEPIVYFFFPTGTASSDETSLLSRFSKFRMGSSEFVQMPIDDLLDGVDRYFKTKYLRNPSVQIPYHRCIYQQILYDFVEKKIHSTECSEHSSMRRQYKCEFFPYLDFLDPSNCLKRVEIFSENKKIFNLDISRIDMELWMNSNVVDFIRCFMIEFDKMNFILYLDRFLENGLNDFFIEAMKRIYGYHSFKVLSRKEFLQKESFPERLIVIKKSDEPMEILLEKIRWLECCVLIEDQNIYSVENREMDNCISFEDLFYYFFYVL